MQIGIGRRYLHYKVQFASGDLPAGIDINEEPGVMGSNPGGRFGGTGSIQVETDPRRFRYEFQAVTVEV